MLPCNCAALLVRQAAGESFVARVAVLIIVATAVSPAVRADEPEKLPPISEARRAVHAAGMLFDGHNDLPWRLRTEGDFGLTKFDLARLDSGQTDIPRLREGGVKAQFWSVYIPSEHP